MRVSILSISLGFALLAACDGSSSSSNTGGGGTAGNTSSSTSDGGGGATGGSATGGSATGGSATGGSATGGSATGGSTTSAGGSMSGDPCETAGADPLSFANDVQPVFSASCGTATSCHFGQFPSAGLSLKVGEAYAELVDVNASQSCNGQKRVAPGSAVGSYIVNKITATDLCPMTKKMPPSATLPDASKQKIIDWICQGAQDN
jgi:hypothetical protein